MFALLLIVIALPTVKVWAPWARSFNGKPKQTAEEVGMGWGRVFKVQFSEPCDFCLMPVRHEN